MRDKGNPIEKMCGTKEILLKNVRGKGNPIEKCAGQRKSYRKMCGTKEILLKNVRSKGNPIEKMCGSKEILLKNVRDKGNPIEILEKTSQSADHPLDRRKSWEKPHNLRTIPWTAGNPGKNLTICGPSPGPPEILEKNLTILRICLSWSWLSVPTSCAEAPCGGNDLTLQKLTNFLNEFLNNFQQKVDNNPGKLIQNLQTIKT